MRSELASQNKKNTPVFPSLWRGTSPGVIVLVTGLSHGQDEYFVGTVVYATPSSDYRIGDYRDNWFCAVFQPYYGDVILKGE